ncbi:MAG: hypothetical protein CM1200mP12_00990 [Gammaproteobacteria bacterium]|nr:MAG: hypothetical protein CM1200mP12_00990 [Gammaproteobacteria bacterium]
MAKKTFIGDIAIDKDRISKVGLVEEQGKGKKIDAGGHLVTPGWVDIHTHYDGQVCWDSYLSPSCWHGVFHCRYGQLRSRICPPLKTRFRRILNSINGRG